MLFSFRQVGDFKWDINQCREGLRMALSNNTSIIHSQKPNTCMFLTLLYLFFQGPCSAVTLIACWPDPSPRGCTHAHSSVTGIPGNAGFAMHTHRSSRTRCRPPARCFPAAAYQGGGGTEARAPGVSPRLDEFPWRAVQGLLAIHSATLTENIDWNYHTFRFSQRCFLFLLRDFFLSIIQQFSAFVQDS